MPLPVSSLELAFSQELELGSLSLFVFFLGSQGKWQQPEDVAVAGHKITQKGMPQNTPKGRVRCAPVVHPVPAEEAIPHQERWHWTPGAMAEAREGGGTSGQTTSQPVMQDFQRPRSWFPVLNTALGNRCLHCVLMDCFGKG